MLENETKNRTCAANQSSDQQTTPVDDIAISVKNLTKKYRIFGNTGDCVKQALTFGRVRFHWEFTALQEVFFDVKKGEAVGIIGRNGYPLKLDAYCLDGGVHCMFGRRKTGGKSLCVGG